MALAQDTSYQIEVLNIDETRYAKTDYSGYNIVEHQCELSDLLGLISISAGAVSYTHLTLPTNREV